MLATRRPRELSTLLHATRDSSLFYLFYHGTEYNGEWIYGQPDGSEKAFRVKEKLGKIEAGGSIVLVCNPGKHMISGFPFPIFYPLDNFNMNDIRDAPDKMTLYTPEGVYVPTTEEAITLVSDFIDGLFEFEQNCIELTH